MSRGVKPFVEEGIEKNNIVRCSVEEVSRNEAKTLEKNLDRSTSCQEAIEGPRTFSIDPPGDEKVSRLQ